MNAPTSLTFFDFVADPNPTYEHFLSTATLDHLVPEVCTYYYSQRPELPKLFEEVSLPTIRLDVPGPIYGKDEVTVYAPGGYSVCCPLSHADAVCARLRDMCNIPGTSFGLFHCMYILAALPMADVEVLAKGFERYAQAAFVHRTALRDTTSYIPR